MESAKRAETNLDEPPIVNEASKRSRAQALTEQIAALLRTVETNMSQAHEVAGNDFSMNMSLPWNRQAHYHRLQAARALSEKEAAEKELEELLRTREA